VKGDGCADFSLKKAVQLALLVQKACLSVFSDKNFLKGGFCAKNFLLLYYRARNSSRHISMRKNILTGPWEQMLQGSICMP
jgi:hypothetical protein